MNNKEKSILNHSTVLIVEDDIKVRKHLKDFLNLFVENVYEANNGEEALLLFNQYHPTFIFSDVKMPKVDGLELVKNIRKINPNIPIVLLSAYSEKEILLEAIQLGLVEYLVKPISIKVLRQLLIKIANFIDTKNLLIIKFSQNDFYNLKEKKFYHHTEPIILTKQEDKLINLFLRYEGELLSEEFLINEIWDYKHKTISALRNLILRLRVKIGKDYIVSVNGYGYKIKRQ